MSSTSSGTRTGGRCISQIARHAITPPATSRLTFLLEPGVMTAAWPVQTVIGQIWSSTMASVANDVDAEHAAAVRRRYLIRFEEDTLRPRPLWIRLIIEFLGTFILVTVAAGSGVINQYADGGPISRTAAVIPPGAVVMAMIYAWGPLSGLHINPR